MRHRIRAVFKDIFPDDEKEELTSYFSGINPDQVKSFILKIVSSSNYNSEWNDWKKLLFDHWFHGDNLSLAEYIFKKVTIQQTQVRNQRKGTYLFLTKTCTLFLLEEILKTKFSGEQKSDLEVEIDLFKAVLLINERFDPIGEFPTIQGELSKVLTKDVMLALTSGLSQYTINNTNFNYLLSLFACQLRKGIYLFNFLKENQPEIFNEFSIKHKCENTYTYLENLTKLSYRIFFDKNHQLDSDSNLIHVNLRDLPNDLRDFIHGLIISSEIIEDEDIDFRQLRARPLIEYKKDVYTVINETFLIQKLYDSVYFDLKEINDNITKTVKNYRKDFTYEFSEKTLFYKVIEEIYKKKSYIKFSGENIDKFMRGGSDYYIRNGNKIFLFECKDNFISAQAKNSRNFEYIKNYIDSRLVEDAGIPQLINNIKFILEKGYKFDENYKINNCVIYPIIVTHRTELDNPGLNLYLKYVFKEKLKELKQKGYNIYKVKELTLINIDTFIICSNLMILGNMTLDDMIDKYHHSTNKNVKYSKSEEDFEEKKGIKMSSFYMFIMNFLISDRKINLKQELDLIRKINIERLSETL